MLDKFFKAEYNINIKRVRTDDGRSQKVKS